ncbi:glycosyl hydrolase family 47-domain-containing protein [Boeremia exigua]|uniref:glycosyl hydrolase family 47-domain-containing protein n=1 Tax=Boeremia exigua TaxID=749465 RepID=UPI001E8CAAF4|nr:glycosyl hydrolase family 47-domain-containing protein [Boeremia exigua]KAH6637386.1 glycosyl hydrolase family 47-domain-containing protein [Boeremia exigua]
MFRMRRYRVFLAFAVITVLAIYKFGTSGATWREAASNAAGHLEDAAEDAVQFIHKPNIVAHETKKLQVDVPAATRNVPLQTPPPPPAAPVNSPASAKSSAAPASSSAIKPKLPQEHLPTVPTPAPGWAGRPGSGAVLDESTIEQVHWSKLPENFPVPPQSMIKLPAGQSKPIKKIQYDFKPETPEAKAARTAKLDTIRNVFKRSWDGYRELAWEHDELKPVSGEFKDPFAGWRATLVDALDTLWIMGLKEEFVDAVKAVATLDFTTTSRADIPLFETTIRYLGGLLAAYDVSGKQHKVLLDKAVELAEVLYSAFDTPNRMPETYYYWRSQFASNAHRASTRVVLAEIGSLSMEFTRLAQLTGEDKYYDAIARITDHLEEFQKTSRLPGMWPTYLDASGCKMVAIDVPVQAPIPPSIPQEDPLAPGNLEETPTPTPTEQLSPGGKKMVPLDLPDPIVLTPNGVNPTWVPPNGGLEDPMLAALGDPAKMSALPPLERRSDDVEKWTPPKKPTDLEADLLALQKGNMDRIKFDAASSTGLANPAFAAPTCVPQGFASSSDYGSEEYTLGGMSDSTYEYLPKQWLLLGGQVAKYRTMYKWSMDVVKKHLLFRPMLPQENDVLYSGKFIVVSPKDAPFDANLEPENAHLTCFAGGMFGMGAKIFDRPEDLEIAKKLTEGCVYAYDMTATGIMPEGYIGVPCESQTECAWNETLYHELIDPRADWRIQNHQEQLQQYQIQLASAESWYAEAMASFTAAPVPIANPQVAAQATPTPSYVFADTLDRRQIIDLLDDATHVNIEDTPGIPAKAANPSPPAAVRPLAVPHTPHQDHDSVMGGESEEGEGPPTKVQPDLNIPELGVSALPSRTAPVFPYLYSPMPVLSHREHVQHRIKEERLPEGVVSIVARNYILRPEAIESVWYMYRITGDDHWRAVGWRMFQNIIKHTTAQHGNSAIDDVTKTAPDLNDSMESFWLAETLKYFYLLFADESLISLDEWVLNTEAHPFRRPT